jgi:hypothetical protein
MPEPINQTAQEKLEEAKQALARKRYDDAKRLLAEAEQSGAPPRWVANLRQVVRAAEEHQDKLGRNSHWVGLLLGGFVYLIILFLPLTPRDAAWIVLALLGVPALIGGIIGRLMGFDAGAGPRFRKAAVVTGFVMFNYAFVSLIWQRTRFAIGSEIGQIFLVWLVVATVYAVIAGAVAGLVSAKLTWAGGGRSAHGTAS